MTARAQAVAEPDMGVLLVVLLARDVPPGVVVFVERFLPYTRPVVVARFCVGDACAPYVRVLQLDDSTADRPLLGQLPTEGVEGRAFSYLPAADRDVVAPWRNLEARLLYPGSVVRAQFMNVGAKPRDIEAVIYGRIGGPT